MSDVSIRKLHTCQFTIRALNKYITYRYVHSLFIYYMLCTSNLSIILQCTVMNNTVELKLCFKTKLVSFDCHRDTIFVLSSANDNHNRLTSTNYDHNETMNANESVSGSTYEWLDNFSRNCPVPEYCGSKKTIKKF